MSRYEVMAVNDATQRGFTVEKPHDNSDFYYVCVDTMLNRIIAYDGGEPEDRNLYRDFAPLVDELNRIDNLVRHRLADTEGGAHA